MYTGMSDDPGRELYGVCCPTYPLTLMMLPIPLQIELLRRLVMMVRSGLGGDDLQTVSTLLV